MNVARGRGNLLPHTNLSLLLVPKYHNTLNECERLGGGSTCWPQTSLSLLFRLSQPGGAVGGPNFPAASMFLKSQLHAYYSSPGANPTSLAASLCPGTRALSQPLLSGARVWALNHHPMGAEGAGQALPESRRVGEVGS